MIPKSTALIITSQRHPHSWRKNSCMYTFPDSINAMYVMHSISFQTFFVHTFKIVVDSWKFSMLMLYILWDDWPIFMISGSNKQLQQQLEYTLLKPDCHSCWISKMQRDTLEERYAIKFCFKLGKKGHRNVWNASDCFWTLLHESTISFWVA